MATPHEDAADAADSSSSAEEVAGGGAVGDKKARTKKPKPVLVNTSLARGNTEVRVHMRGNREAGVRARASRGCHKGAVTCHRSVPECWPLVIGWQSEPPGVMGSVWQDGHKAPSQFTCPQ